MTMSWRDYYEPRVCLTVASEAPTEQPDKKNNCPDYFYRAVAIISERKNIFSPGKIRLYRKASPDDQVVEKFFGKNKFSLPASKINQRRKV